MSGGIAGAGSLDLAYRIGRTVTIDLGTIALNKSAVDTVNALTVTVSGGTGLSALFAGASISVPGSGTNSQRFGPAAIASSVDSLAIGSDSTASTGTGNTAVGQ